MTIQNDSMDVEKMEKEEFLTHEAQNSKRASSISDHGEFIEGSAAIDVRETIYGDRSSKLANQAEAYNNMILKEPLSDLSLGGSNYNLGNHISSDSTFIIDDEEKDERSKAHFSSSMENLVKASARPQFKTMMSETALHDPITDPVGIPSESGTGKGDIDELEPEDSVCSHGSVLSICDLKRLGSKESSAGYEMEFSLFPSRKDLMQMYEKRSIKIQPVGTGKALTRMVRNSFRRPNDNTNLMMKKEQSVTFLDERETCDDEGKIIVDFPPISEKRNKTSTKDRMRKHKNQKLLPKNTVPVKCVGKKSNTSDFSPLLLISTFKKVHDGPIWCTGFSQDGKYFATAGMDGVVQIWDVSPTHEDSPNSSDSDNDMIDASSIEFSDSYAKEIKILSSEPLQIFNEHGKDIVDMSWSRTNFLLSASLDKTVRLWHPTRPVCLKLFRHADLVTSVSFHPTDDRYFLSGGFDKKIRIWSIPDGRVKEWAQAPHYVTAAEYHPDGTFVAAGLFDGKVMFYSVSEEKLKYYTQINCKNRRAKEGRKVTGLAFLQNLSIDKVDTDTNKKMKRKANLRAASAFLKNVTGYGNKKKEKKAKQQILITTNDSRLRLVGLNDFCIIRKFKGISNSTLQIRARLSESGSFIACGSESRSCTIWNTATKRNPLHVNVTDLYMYDKVYSYETFEATKADPPVVTDSIFVPRSSMKRAISSSDLFPSLSSLQRIKHDLSSAAIVTCDYEGTIRVFIRKVCLDAVYK